MNRLGRITMVMLTGSGLCFGAAGARAQEPVPAFKAGVDLVRVHTVVRDRRGRFVTNLTERDFEILDDGESRTITDFSHDTAGVSAALLFDISGSMKAKLDHAREAANHVLSWLHAEHDEAAVFAFDTKLEEIAPYAPMFLGSGEVLLDEIALDLAEDGRLVASASLRAELIRVEGGRLQKAVVRARAEGRISGGALAEAMRTEKPALRS